MYYAADTLCQIHLIFLIYIDSIDSWILIE